MKNQVSNYEIFKQQALKRILTFDQEQIIERLSLASDENYIYVKFFGRLYRLNRQNPEMERSDQNRMIWQDASPNEVLTIGDLFCHTPDPIRLSGTFMSLQSLNRVKSGTTQTTLASGMFEKTAQIFDQKMEQLQKACEQLGGIPAGKGDVAYEFPLFEQIHVRFSFYGSDDEFDPQITMLFDSEICNYLFYETLYYVVGIVTDRLVELVSSMN